MKMHFFCQCQKDKQLAYIHTHFSHTVHISTIFIYHEHVTRFINSSLQKSDGHKSGVFLFVQLIRALHRL